MVHFLFALHGTLVVPLVIFIMYMVLRMMEKLTDSKIEIRIVKNDGRENADEKEK